MENKSMDDLQVAFKEFKDANDERLKQIESKGSADALTEEKVAKLNDHIAKLEAKHKDAEKRMANLEVETQRKGFEGSKETTEKLQAELKAFNSMTSRKNTEEEYMEYKEGMLNFIRSGVESKSLSIGVDRDGGYLVNPDTSGQIASFIYETSPMRQVANVKTITTDRLIGGEDLDEVTTGWVGEKQARTETTTPTLGEWEIPVHEIYAEPRATQQLLDDAGFDAEAWLAEKVADKMIRNENLAFVTGDGVKKPRGFLDYATSANITSTSDYGSTLQHVVTGTSGGFNATDGGDAIIDLVYSLKSAYRNNATFAMTRLTMSEVRKLKDGQGNYLWQPDYTVARSGSLLGFNIVEMEDMPELSGNSLSIAFGDFNKGYQIVDRMGVRILRDNLTSKPYTKFYTTKRVGGDVVNFEAIKLLKFSA